MNKIKYFPLITLVVIVILPQSLFAQAGNDNATGVSGMFNGNVTTAGSYDPYTANATRSVTDLAVAGGVGAYPLAFTRTMNSRYTPGLPVEFGEAGGWRHSYQWSVDSQVILSPGASNPMPSSYTVNFPDGRREIFQNSAFDPYMRSSPGTRERFQKPIGTGNNYCYLILADGGKIWFQVDIQRIYPEGQGQTTSTFDFYFLGIIDPHGLVTTITYPGDNSETVTEPAGRWIKLFYATLSWNGETVLDHVTASDGRTVRYDYSQYVTSGGTGYTYLKTVFSYSNELGAFYSYQAGNIDPDGRPLIKTCIDPLFNGPMWRMAYDFAPNATGVVYGQLYSENYLSGSGTVGTAVSTLFIDQNAPNARTETRGDGPQRTFTYSGARLAGSTDFKNITASQAYGSNGYMNSFTDRETNETDLQSDPLTGNVTLITFPLTPSDSARATVRSVYGSANCPDPNNRDGTNPYYLYSVTDERNLTTTYTRDGNKRIARIDYPDYAYETFSYNAFGQVQSHRMTSGGVETFEYDAANGRLMAYRDPYHAAGNPTARYQYDALGRISGVTDARGTQPGDINYTTDYDYNPRGQLTKITHPVESGTSLRYYIRHDYYPNGTLQSTMDERGQTTSYSYDDYKRSSLSTAPPAYDGDTTPRTTAIYYTRDGSAGVQDYTHADANPGSIVSPGDKYIRTWYDENSRTRATIVGLGNEAAMTTYTYDSVGNLKTVTDPAGQASGLYTQYFYDPRNRLAAANDPISTDRNDQGYTVSLTYDAAGNKKSEQRANNQLITYDLYDAMNRLQQQSVQRDAGVKDVTLMGYDYGGNLLAFQDARGNTYFYGYDLMNRRKSLLYPRDDSGAMRQESYDYDAANNMDTYTDRSGAVQTLIYDNRNRQTYSSWNIVPQNTHGDRTTSYDPVGNILHIGAGTDLNDFTYDFRNRKTSEIETSGGQQISRTVGYTYDADSNRRTITYPSGSVFTYDYNSRNQLWTVSDGASTVVTYTYDTSGNRRTRTLRNGTSTTYVPDPLNRPLSIEHDRGATNLGRFDYSYDSMNRLKWAKRDSSRGDTYGYYLDGQLKIAQFDAFNVDTGSPTGAANTTSLVYDANGNRTSQNNTTSASYSYGVNLLNEYNSVNGSAPAYDAKGNLSDYNGSHYEYDAENRITDAVTTSNTLYFYYDGLGRQIVRYVNGQWIYSVWDGWSLIEEYSVSNSLIHGYLHGGGSDEMVQRWDSGHSNTVWYYQDGQGSTSHLANDAGTIIESYKYPPADSGAPSIYNASGNLITASNFDNRFLYTGRDWLKEVGLYDYRNRFYHPGLGRFLQPDPTGFAGDASNLYRYCGGDPVNNVDPTGEYYWLSGGGRNWTVNIPISWSGPGATAQAIASFTSGIQGLSGYYGGVYVTFQVTSPGFFGFGPTNSVTVLAGFGQNGFGWERGSDEAVWYAGGGTAFGFVYTPEFGAAHSVFHFLYFKDGYNQETGDLLPGVDAGDILGNRPGSGPTLAEISQIIQKGGGPGLANLESHLGQWSPSFSRYYYQGVAAFGAGWGTGSGFNPGSSGGASADAVQSTIFQTLFGTPGGGGLPGEGSHPVGMEKE